MEISKKDWKKYIQSLAKINEVAANEMLFWIKMHPNATRNTFIEIANAIAVKYGEASGALACQMYDEIAKVQKVKVQPAEIAPTTTIPESAKMVNALYNQKLKIAPGVGRQVKQVTADTMLKNAKRDRAEFAWITSGDGCMFCRMISSFGWQHASKKVMNGDHAKHIHNNCKCEFAIRFDGTMGVEGYNPDAIKKEFDNAEGNTLEEKVNYLRREKDKRERKLLKYQKNSDKIKEKDIANQSDNSLEKGIRKYKEQIYKHQRYIENPKIKVFEWDKYSDKHKAGLIKHWEKEIKNFKESVRRREDELNRRKNNDK